MIYSLWLVFNIFTTLFYATCAFLFLKRNGRINSMFIFIALYAFGYGLLPLANSVIYNFHLTEYDTIWVAVDTSPLGIKRILIFYSLSIIGYIMLFAGYYGTIKDGALMIRRKPEYVLSTYEFRKVTDDDYKRCRYTAWICLAISFTSLLIWARAYGSIFNLIQVAGTVRSGNSDVSNSLAFFKRPANAILICAFLFFVLFLNSKGKKMRYLDFIGLAVSLFGSYLYLMANDGRTAMITFFAAFAWIAYGSKRITHTFRFIGIAVIISLTAMWVLLRLDSVTNYIRTGEWIEVDRTLWSIINEFEFSLRGGQTCIAARADGRIGYTFYNDFVSGLLAWIPARFKPVNPDNIWFINTDLVYGVDFQADSPCSFISTAYYDLGIVGVLLYPSLLGILLRKIDEYVTRHQNEPFVLALGAQCLIYLFSIPTAFAMYFSMLLLFPLAFVSVVYWGIGNTKIYK